MVRPPDPDSPAGRNLAMSQDAGEAMRLFVARRLGKEVGAICYADLACDELYLVEMLIGLRHWADHHAADYANADRRAKAAFARQTRADGESDGPQIPKEA